MCPDIAFAINQLASYTANPSLQHIIAVKRILRYLSGIRNFDITYKHIPNSPISFQGWTNASYKSWDDGKSTMGYVFLAAEGIITWQLMKQPVTTQSFMEAEYIALWKDGKEASWLWNLYNELGLTQKKPTILVSDSDDAVSIAWNSLFHKRMKHIDSRFH